MCCVITPTARLFTSQRATKRPMKRGYELALRSEAESMGTLWRGLTQLA